MSQRIDGTDPHEGADPQSEAKAEKARQRAQRPFYKKKRFAIPGALVALTVVSSITQGGNTKEAADTSTTLPAASSAAPAAPASTAPAVPPAPAAPAAPPPAAYVGKLKDDMLGGGTGAPGTAVMLSGWTATAGPVKSVASSFGPKNLCTDVTLVNRDTEQQEYNGFSWKLQSPGGNVQDITFSGANDLTSGGLAPGGTVAKTVCFADQSGGSGQYVLSWAPDIYSNKVRGIWLNTL